MLEYTEAGFDEPGLIWESEQDYLDKLDELLIATKKQNFMLNPNPALRNAAGSKSCIQCCIEQNTC